MPAAWQFIVISSIGASCLRHGASCPSLSNYPATRPTSPTTTRSDHHNTSLTSPNKNFVMLSVKQGCCYYSFYNHFGYNHIDPYISIVGLFFLFKVKQEKTALAEFGHIFWINPTFQLISAELAPLVHDSHERGVAVIAQSVSYSTFAVTHPEMLKFIKSDKAKLTYHPHLEIFAMMIHNTPEVHENIMKLFTACALEKACLAPDGAKWQCQWDFTGRKHANCHRYDESALNILLKNMFDFDSTKFAHGNTYFRPYEERAKPKLKYCRDPSDIRDSEL